MIANSIADAKAQLPTLIERVQAGEEVVIGKAVAVLAPSPGDGYVADFRHPTTGSGSHLIATTCRKSWRGLSESGKTLAAEDSCWYIFKTGQSGVLHPGNFGGEAGPGPGDAIKVCQAVENGFRCSQVIGKQAPEILTDGY